jgi:cytochrome c-type biogenesis protein CcmH/NrfF
MYRSLFGRGARRERVRSARRRPRSRAGNWLLWILLVIVILIVLSLMFGGFRKGTKVGGLGHLPAAAELSLPAGNSM